MARSQRPQQANTCHTHVVTASSPSSQPAQAAPSSPVYLYLKCTNGFYLTEDHKSVKAPSEIQSPASVWYEQHVGNGYFIYKSHHGRLLSVCDHGDVKLAQLKNPVKQKCMFYREQIGDHCRFRSVSGFFLCVDKSGHVTSTKSPQKNALFALQLVPVHSIPPPPSQQGHASRDADVTHGDSTTSHASQPYAPPPSNVNVATPGDSTHSPHSSQGYNSPAPFSPASASPYGTPPPQQGGYNPPQQGGYTPPHQGGYNPQQGGYTPQNSYAPPQGVYTPPQGVYAPPPQGGYAPPPQSGGYAPQYTPYGAPEQGGYGYDASRGLGSPPPQQSQPNGNSSSTPSYLMGLNATSNQSPY